MSNTIDELIGAHEFPSTMHKAIVNIQYTSRCLDVIQNSVFKKHGFLQQHWNVIRIICANSPNAVTPGYIKEAMFEKGRDLTRLITKLVQLGFVHRQKSETNKRLVEVSLTEHGRIVYEQINAEVNALTAEYLNFCSNEDCEILNELLDRLRDGAIKTVVDMKQDER